MAPENGDLPGRLLPPTLFRLLLDAAGRDATARGAGMERLREQGLAWMLVRLVAETSRWPAVPEECVLSTWPTSFGGATAERDFTLESDGAEGAKGHMVAEATSRWAMVDLQARRAVRLPAFIRALPVASERASVRLPPALEQPPEAPLLAEAGVEVKSSDLDQLGHANSVRYLVWALAALPPAWTEEWEIRHLDLSFRREARGGDRLRCRAYRVSDELVVHEIGLEPPKGGGEMCALVSTRWRRRG
jgi:acyl-ACP thioesterase